jgi:cytochrome P450
MAMIGSHPNVRRRVAREVRQAPETLDNAVHLRYTQASVKEAQRLHPVIGMSLSRTVPVGGVHLHGSFFPAGTTVGCNPVALHRNPEVFGVDAHRYNPDRWLQDDDPAQVRMMERTNLTWGGGSRSCPGRHLAELVVNKVVPALLREFDLEITTMPEESEMPCYFMAMLTGVKARFKPLDPGADHGADRPTDDQESEGAL